jgi:hypothetical protein
MKQWYISKDANGGQRLSSSLDEAKAHAGPQGGVRELQRNPAPAGIGYAVVDGKGRLVHFSPSENDAVDYAVRSAGSSGVVAMDDIAAVDLEQNPMPRIGVTPAETAYAKSGLPQVLRRLGYGSALTREDVEKWSLDAAWARIKHKLPTGDETTRGRARSAKKKTVNVWQKDAKSAARALLKQNAKTAKILKGDTLKNSVADVFVSVGLSLAPHQLGFRGLVTDIQGRMQFANISPEMRRVSLPGESPTDRDWYTLCAGSSLQCRQTCLAYSGQNSLQDEAYVAKVKLTEALYEEPAAFMRLLLEAIRKHFWRYGHTDKYKATKQGIDDGVETTNVDDEELMRVDDDESYDDIVEAASSPKGNITVSARYHPRVRLNVYQDIPWELLCPDLLDQEWLNQRPEGVRGAENTSRVKGILYDYTKVAREPSDSLHITFSCTGTESNLRACEQVLQTGINVAVVFIGAMENSEGQVVVDRRGGKPLQKLSKNVIVADQMLSLYPWKLQLIPGGQIWSVLNGDISDIRDQDPPGYVVGLTYKIPSVRYMLTPAQIAHKQQVYEKKYASWEARTKKALAAGKELPKQPDKPGNYGYKPAVDAQAIDKFITRVRVVDVDVQNIKTRKVETISALITTHNPNQSHVLIS